MLKSIKQIAQETQIEAQIQNECFFCKLQLTSDDFKEDKITKTKNFIAHTSCADKAVKDYWTPKFLAVKCDYCHKEINLSTDRWIEQDDKSKIHIDCIEPALNEYKMQILETEYKLVSKMNPNEPFPQGWHETCELCGYITDSPNENHVCPERV